MISDSLNSSQPIDIGALSNDVSVEKKKVPVYANIYNFSKCFNSCCSCCGLGLYHTGI
mgnify:CR=1 FL=1